MSTSSGPPSSDGGGRRPEEPAFHGRRRGKKLRRTPRNLLDTLLPALAIGRPPPGAGLDPRTLFARPVDAVWLEVGFGGGEHLAAQAAARPQVGLIGCEVFVNGVASLLGHLDRSDADNVRIFADDARLLFPALPDACLDKIFVLFPDPWPKTRHAERRFIGPGNLDTLARLLGDGGELRVASDDAAYITWAIRHLRAHAAFAGPPDGVHPTCRPADWPATRYEGKAIAQGRSCTFLSFRRRPRPLPGNPSDADKRLVTIG